MSRLPRLTGQVVVRALSRAGFEIIRQRGSHLFLKHQDGRATVVPVHSGKVLGPGIMSKILTSCREIPHRRAVRGRLPVARKVSINRLLVSSQFIAQTSL